MPAAPAPPSMSTPSPPSPTGSDASLSSDVERSHTDMPISSSSHTVLHCPPPFSRRPSGAHAVLPPLAAGQTPKSIAFHPVHTPKMATNRRTRLTFSTKYNGSGAKRSISHRFTPFSHRLTPFSPFFAVLHRKSWIFLTETPRFSIISERNTLRIRRVHAEYTPSTRECTPKSAVSTFYIEIMTGFVA